MSQRNSTYERIERDAYPTPGWVTRALLPHLPPLDWIWEPAAGGLHMAEVLAEHALVVTTDIAPSDREVGKFDFLKDDFGGKRFAGVQAIITNPPYDHATQFIERALQFFRGQPRVRRGTYKIVAMLLKVDFDSGVTRRHLFGDCQQFSKKVVLRKRIKWFEPPPDKKNTGPSDNHAWFLWDFDHRGPATIAYAPSIPMVEDAL